MRRLRTKERPFLIFQRLSSRKSTVTSIFLYVRKRINALDRKFLSALFGKYVVVQKETADICQKWHQPQPAGPAAAADADNTRRRRPGAAADREPYLPLPGRGVRCGRYERLSSS